MENINELMGNVKPQVDARRSTKQKKAIVFPSDLLSDKEIKKLSSNVITYHIDTPEEEINKLRKNK